MSQRAPSQTHSLPSSRPEPGWLVSCAFWTCLFCSAGSYSAVVLAPKLVTSAELTRVHRANQWRLVELQRQIEYLKRVIDAHEFDPAFARERARSDFELRPADEEEIPVSSHLRLQIGHPESRPARLPDKDPGDPWYLPWLRHIVTRPAIATGLLAGAALTIVLAFTFLNPVGRDPRL